MDSSTQYLYILFSATPYRIGKLIRYVTGEPYNHVSIGLEQDLTTLYAFARRYYSTPLYGGFVTEQPCRYHHNGATAKIRLCQIPITGEQHEYLQQRFAQMSSQPKRYIYNHLSAMMAPFHRKIRVRDAFTCAEFTVSVLQELGLPFSSRLFYSIDEISEILSPYEIYVGDYPVPAEEEGAFFEPQSLRRIWYLSAKNFLTLFWRKTIA